MCGVFGVVNANASLSAGDLRDSVVALLLASESRGSEAAGLAVWGGDGIAVRKSGASPKRFLHGGNVDRLFERLVGVDTSVVIGHARMVTNGSAIFDENNQPAVADGITVIHNGIVTNFDALSGTSAQGESDTAAIARYLAASRGTGCTIGDGVARLFGELLGSATLAVLDRSSDDLVLATNTGSLYVGMNRRERVVIFGSEERILQEALSSRGARRLPVASVVKVPPGEGLVIDRRTGAARSITLGAYDVREDGHSTAITSVKSGAPPVRLLVDPAPDAVAEGVERTRSFAAQVQRCTRCILPATMPFLEFDDDGVCSVCRVYEPTQIRPVDDLERLLAPLRTDGEDPTCVLAFSGGRDSAYGLHLLVEEFGVKPITLTYDWGMVTDLARRNQARMTGALGVEHVLVSADIATKRRNIGLNLEAWMRDPDLGMVPLLMAGDKQFFLHARNLSTSLDLPTVVFCVNPLEMTYFKSGFAGVRDQRYYTSSTWRSKTQQLGYYASRYLRNPSYINRSLLDTAQATYATYFKPHDYLQLFEWVDFDEDHINTVLTEQYGWETDPTTTTTWRIGDGTAPFYNYVYWRCAGFTESDTFRSNQIREGRITRDRALTLVAAENEPRWSRIDEYLELVGVDRDRALAAIEDLARRSPVGA